MFRGLLTAGAVDAVIVESPIADYMTSVDCDIFETGPLIELDRFTWLFPIDTSDDYIKLVDRSLDVLIQQGEAVSTSVTLKCF